VLFAVARTVGWVSQWKELIEDPAQRIGRPRQIYRGAGTRDYTPVSRRDWPAASCCSCVRRPLKRAILRQVCCGALTRMTFHS